MAAQLKLIKFSNEFGGELVVGKRKSARPVATKRPMHLVLKSSKARGERSLLTKKNAAFIRTLLCALSQKYFVQVLEFANSGNHLHLLVRAKDRAAFKAFRRVFAGRIAMHVTQSRKGLAGKFWDHTMFSRIVEWGKDFRNVQAYVIKNVLESMGLISRTRKKKPPKLTAKK